MIVFDQVNIDFICLHSETPVILEKRRKTITTISLITGIFR